MVLNLVRTTKRQNAQITQHNTTPKGVLVNSTADTFKKSRLREREREREREDRQSLV